VRKTPPLLVVDRIHEERPTVLQVGDHRHTDHAEGQLPPSSKAYRSRVVRGNRQSVTHVLVVLVFVRAKNITRGIVGRGTKRINVLRDRLGIAEQSGVASCPLLGESVQ